MWFASIMLLPPSHNFDSCKSVIDHHFFLPLSKERKQGRKGKKKEEGSLAMGNLFKMTYQGNNNSLPKWSWKLQPECQVEKEM